MSAVRRRTAWIVSIAVAACTVGVSCAWADGDPASDFLLKNQVFLSAEATGAASGPGRELVSAVAAANRAGFAVRVAVIPTSYDLGSVVPLWRRPQNYAQFLGTELSLVYTQRLVVVMPNGFGVFWKGHVVSSEQALLDRVATGSTPRQLLVASRVAVRRLALAAGVRIGNPAVSGTPHGGDATWTALGALAVALLVLAAAWLLLRGWLAPALRSAAAVLRPGLRAPLRLAARARQARSARGPPAEHVQRIGPLVVAVAVATLLLGGAVLGVILLRPGPAASSAATAAKGGPAFRWAAGRQVAPDFTLTDQNGRAVSLSTYRGHPVIVTFIDPLCRNLCPLEAQVLNEMDRQLPPAKRPTILAVSVDQWADTRADLLQDFSRWSLVPQWRWAVGSPSALRAVWKGYDIQVYVNTKRIAGTTIHEITHIEGAYLIDGTGHARALFLWPFTPTDVETTLAQLN